MRKFLSVLVIAFALSMTMSSCFTHKYVVGDGPQTGVTSTERNNFFLFGLVTGNVSDPQEMAGGAKDFEVTEVHTFVDGLLRVITFGIYTPTTTKVQK